MSTDSWGRFRRQQTANQQGGTKGDSKEDDQEYEKAAASLEELEHKDLPTWTDADKKKYEQAIKIMKKQQSTLDPAKRRGLKAGSAHAHKADALHQLTLGHGGEIGRAVQQECRDRSRMPSSA
eukprot:TRINITY_DN29993_c0_g1_i3.p1 TRINITY_DN29993_c0_g1~~TRINITY_DN29993_c0_g1_i3.p1  ORF type:complete len:123 (+),score=27.36 TRINITY_DN29993_c0_g1_i3:126-494(+)